MDQEWLEIKQRDASTVKIADLRKFVEKHNLSVKLNTGGAARRTKFDVIDDIDNAVKNNRIAPEPARNRKAYKPKIKEKEIVENPPSEEEKPEQGEKGEDNPGQSLRKSWAEVDQDDQEHREDGNMEMDSHEGLVELRALAEKGKGTGIIDFVNLYNLSSVLSKATLLAIVEDCDAHFKSVAKKK